MPASRDVDAAFCLPLANCLRVNAGGACRACAARYGHSCEAATEHWPRSLLGWALRFTQPGRGIGPGDS
ncbi:hypothetical protein C9J98_09820 [Stenotrophomonas panacihumi]|nr:hypothetical protein C9J98_09820 [Stenotrophomonas panacihumi]